MKCRRAFEADLLAVLHGEDADGDFRAHYPSCPDCASEVGVWRELDAMLRAGVPDGGAHPEPETLLAFVDAPTTLASDVRGALERHLAACRVCADEVKAIGAFDPARLGASEPERAGAASRRGAGSARGWLPRLVWHPAFAYALVALLLVPIAREQWPRVATRVASEGTGSYQQRAPAADVDLPAKALAPVPAEPSRAAELHAESKADGTSARSGPAVAVPRATSAVMAERATEEDLARRERSRADDGAMRAPESAPARIAKPAPAALEDRERLQWAKPKQQLADRMANPSAFAARDGAPSAAAPAAPAGALPQTFQRYAPSLILEVRPSETPSFEVPEEGAFLRVIPPPDLAGGTLDVGVRGRTADRYPITMRVTDRAKAIDVHIPQGWLLPGDYTVALQPIDAAGRPSAPPTVLGFSVRGAAGTR